MLKIFPINNSQREGIYYVLGDENTKESCKYCLDFNSEKLEFAAMIVIASLAALFFIGLLCWSYKSKKHDYRKDNPENGAPTKLTRLDLENQSAALLK